MLFERYCNGNIRSILISILFPVAHAHMNCCFANNHTQGNSFNGKPFFLLVQFSRDKTLFVFSRFHLMARWEDCKLLQKQPSVGVLLKMCSENL